MRINLNNYEAFFLDYKEGTLGAAQLWELFAFLELHPELKEELDAFEEVVLEEDLVFENKESLKKTGHTDESLIAYTEGLLTPAERGNIEALASQNKQLQKELELYKLSRVRPDTSVKFPAKAKLKRGGLVILLRANPVYLRAAAAVLLLLGLLALVNKIAFTGGTEKTQPVLANKNAKPVLPPVNSTASANLQPVAEKNGKALAANTSTANIASRAKKEVANTSEHKIKPQADSSQQAASHQALLADNKQDNAPLREDEPVLVNAAGADNAVTHTSYINSSVDEDDAEEEEEPVVLASAAPAKKTFFDKLTNAARRVNALGVKSVNANENGKRKSLILGGIVVSESHSN